MKGKREEERERETDRHTKKHGGREGWAKVSRGEDAKSPGGNAAPYISS